MKLKNNIGLFKESLEGISRNVFRDHSEIITQLIGDSPGIYALYDENELYYVGRASALKRRVNQHLKDRHNALWTHFSLFLIKKSKYIGDIEAMLIRIADPVGNTVKPKRKDSRVLFRKLRTLLKQKYKAELLELLGKQKRTRIKKNSHKGTLKGLVEQRTPVFKTYKGKEYKAVVTPSGTIVFRAKSYQSPTGAAKAIVDRKTVNGWHFWKIKNANGEWVRLGDY